MDHHCIWLNNCIGYNNYRTFLVLLFHLVVGCCYGISILFNPYYQLILNHMEQINQVNDWKEILTNRQQLSFLPIPTPIVIFNELRIRGTVEPEMIIQLIFPFLLCVGILLTMFFTSHCKYVIKSLTTLEYMATLKFKKEQTLLGNGLCDIKIVNPFHRGCWENIRNTMNSNRLKEARRKSKIQ